MLKLLLAPSSLRFPFLLFFRSLAELLVRSHEVKELGFEQSHGGKCITIFSAPNYCDQMGNKGAWIRFGSDMKPNFVQFDAVPHPNVRPMQYASTFMNFA